MLSFRRHTGLHILLPLFLCVMALASSCSESKRDEAKVVGNAAKLYYEYLLQGKYEAYVDGFYRPDSIPDGYRSQLIDNAKMFVGSQKEEHQGIKEINVGHVKVDTTQHIANVFLILTYGDKGKEQVVVPMIQKKGMWLMR